MKLKTKAKSKAKLKHLRKKIDDLDRKILKLLSRRFFYSPQVAKCKQNLQMPLLQKSRLQELLYMRKKQSIKYNIDKNFIKKLFRFIHDESLRIQKKSIRTWKKGNRL